jgi:MFS superfamily sulfate permease-like transporter
MITFLVGVYMFVAGLLRLGKLVGFVSNAVMTGFVMGASLLIIIGELGDFSGYEPSGATDLAKILTGSPISLIGIRQPPSSGCQLSSLFFFLKRIRATEKMASIIVLILVSVAVYFLGLNVELVGDIATIPGSLSAPMMSDLSVVPNLALGSLSVAIVALVQGAGISTAYPNPDNIKSSQSRDFIGEGLGNLAGSFFQSMAIGGSLSHQLTRREVDGRYEEQDVPESFPSNDATIISLGGLNFFAEAPILEENLPDALSTQNAVVILRLRGTDYIGSTAIKWLENYNDKLRENNSLLMLAGIESKLLEELKRAGVVDQIGEENIFEKQAALGESEDAALEAAQRWLEEQAGKQAVEESAG